MRKVIWSCFLWTWVLEMVLLVMVAMGMELRRVREVMPKGSVGVQLEGRAQVEGEVNDVTLAVREGMPARAVVVGNYNCYELPNTDSKVISYLSEGLIIRLTGIERGRWQFVMAGGDDWIKCWVKDVEVNR